MKKILLAGLGVIFFAGAAWAESQQKSLVYMRPYVSVKGTYSDLKMDGAISDKSAVFKTADSDGVWGVSVAGGVKVCAFRAELEYNQTLTTAKDTREFNPIYGEFSKGSQSYRSYMLNGYFDIPTYTRFRPYIGAGIGLAQVKNRLGIMGAVSSVSKSKDTNFAYQLMAGLGYNIDRNWALDAGYRYINNGDSEWNVNGGKQKVKFDSIEHQFTAGVRYTF
jgi:opacity protein-like surface antigen